MELGWGNYMELGWGIYMGLHCSLASITAGEYKPCIRRDITE